MDQLQIFSSEVSRVAREVGTEGILGGQAQIVGVDGTWKELTNNGKFLNCMAGPWPWHRLVSMLTTNSECYGPKSDRPGPGNCISNYRCGTRRFDAEDRETCSG